MSNHNNDELYTAEEIEAFEAWYDEIEIYSLRCERIIADILEPASPALRFTNLRSWMLRSFVEGRRSMDNGQ